jgi:hypothetical protein
MLSIQWDALDRLRKDTGLDADECPESAFTIHEYGTHCDVSYSTAMRQLENQMKAGTITEGKQRRMDARGRMVMYRVFWVAP